VSEPIQHAPDAGTRTRDVLIWQPYPQGGITGWLFVMAERHQAVYRLTVPL
jgi:hypothetical protein